MLKMIAGLVAGVIGFMVALSLTAGDEIAAEVSDRLDEDFIPQCVRHLQASLPVPATANSVCSCMKAEFGARGYEITDSFGENLPEMQDVTQVCVGLYN